MCAPSAFIVSSQRVLNCYPELSALLSFCCVLVEYEVYLIANVEKMYAWDRVGLLERSSGRAGCLKCKLRDPWRELCKETR